MKTIIILLIGAVIVLLLRKRGQATTKPTASRSTGRKNGSSGKGNRPENEPATNKPYRSTSIKCGAHACESAKALQGERFLLNKSPQIPLAECDATVCNCKYIHHADRRNDQGDRRQPMALRTSLYGRNGKPDRRGSSDQAGRRRGE